MIVIVVFFLLKVTPGGGPPDALERVAAARGSEGFVSLFFRYNIFPVPPGVGGKYCYFCVSMSKSAAPGECETRFAPGEGETRRTRAGSGYALHRDIGGAAILPRGDGGIEAGAFVGIYVWKIRIARGAGIQFEL